MDGTVRVERIHTHSRICICPPHMNSRRSLAVAVITGASYVGAVVAFALTPWIIQHYGWRQARLYHTFV